MQLRSSWNVSSTTGLPASTCSLGATSQTHDDPVPSVNKSKGGAARPQPGRKTSLEGSRGSVQSQHSSGKAPQHAGGRGNSGPGGRAQPQHPQWLLLDYFLAPSVRKVRAFMLNQLNHKSGSAP